MVYERLLSVRYSNTGGGGIGRPYSLVPDPLSNQESTRSNQLTRGAVPNKKQVIGMGIFKKILTLFPHYIVTKRFVISPRKLFDGWVGRGLSQKREALAPAGGIC